MVYQRARTYSILLGIYAWQSNGGKLLSPRRSVCTFRVHLKIDQYVAIGGMARLLNSLWERELSFEIWRASNRRCALPGHEMESRCSHINVEHQSFQRG
jgi:hypothetical protein